MRLTSFATMAFLSLGVAGYAVVAYGFLPLGSLLLPEMQVTFRAFSLAIYAHVFGAVVALALGPFQFSRTLRTRRPALHRWCGRLYLGVGVLVGGLAGLFMSTHAYGGPVARWGFAGLALAWLYTGTRAYLAIRSGNVAAHQRWMVRNFSLTFAAVTLRLYLPALAVVGVPFESAYPAVSWLCWIPNLLVAELLFNRTAPVTAAA